MGDAFYFLTKQHTHCVYFFLMIFFSSFEICQFTHMGTHQKVKHTSVKYTRDDLSLVEEALSTIDLAIFSSTFDLLHQSPAGLGLLNSGILEIHITVEVNFC